MRDTLFGLAGGLLLCGALTAGAQAEDTIRWRMTTIVPETSNFYQLFALPLVKRVEELTDGRVVIEPYPAGIIAPSFEAHDAVLDGTADAVQAPPIHLVNRDPANALVGTIPGGMGPDALMHWMYQGGGKELLAEFRRETLGLHSIPAGLGGSELLAHAHKPIRTAEDLKGVKFRTAGAFAEILSEHFDAATTVVPGSEVYAMMERKAIDATEWSGPSENRVAGLQETAKYIMYPGSQTNAFFMEFAVKQETWDALPEDLQTKIEAAAQLATMDTLLAFDARDMEAWAELKKGRNEIVRIDDSLIQDIREAGRTWAYAKAEEQEAAGNPWMGRIADSYYAFYDNWLENAEFRAIDVKSAD
ncbi:MAG: C4-dicarboxylate ABC transporter substrate-binding protein [Tistlia sp.]|uniref:C4-dicarboxylate ABC transporter substrate-binding protein n=1 Tax=Tistlia sp. TaxID=3057121 RepID=UPI0034A5806B